MTRNNITIGKRQCQSKFIANTYGFVRTKAYYYDVDKAERNSIQDGNSRIALINNKSVRGLFHNAIINGGMKHNSKIYKTKKGYEDLKQFRYKLISWIIVYTTSKPIRIQHNEFSNKTYIITESTKNTGYDLKSRAYQNDAFNAKKQNNIVSRKVNKIIKENHPEDVPLPKNKRY